MSKKLEDLYQQLLRAALSEKSAEEIDRIVEREKQFPELDCLLHPKDYPVVWKSGECLCDDKSRCTRNCLFEALEPGDGGIRIDAEKCVGCGLCAEGCDVGVINASRDLVAMLLAMKSWQGPIYALVAPAISGQLGKDVPMGQLRSALKRLGFDGMVEVALFADILTLKEAFEFDQRVRTEADFQLTSCCCPIWIAMIRKSYEQLVSHVPAAVSPMIAAGRTIKFLYPGAMTVFVGPCMAKKAEARDKDLAGAVDFVLTFQELRDLFAFTATDPSKLEISEKEHSSSSGIGYAYSGGVSDAIAATVEKISPSRPVPMVRQQADGAAACKTMLAEILAGRIKANFYEGMGCVGGCVGGPKRVLPAEQGREQVQAYASQAKYATPIENPYVVELCHRLGFDDVDSLLEKSRIFTRELEK